MKANAAQQLITLNKQTKRKKKDEVPEEIVDDDLMGRVRLDCMLDIV